MAEEYSDEEKKGFKKGEWPFALAFALLALVLSACASGMEPII